MGRRKVSPEEKHTRTPFGEYFQNLRKQRKETAKSVAGFLGVSVAYVSQVELGWQPVPKSWAQKIAERYELTEAEQVRMNRLIAESMTVMRLNLKDTTPKKRRAAIVFQNTFEEMTDHDAVKLTRAMNKIGQRAGSDGDAVDSDEAADAVEAQTEEETAEDAGEQSETLF